MTYRSPDGPPRGPASPCPSIAIRWPLSIPAGMLTWSRRSSRSLPSPLQAWHGVETTRPSPLQRGQAVMFTIWPRIVCETRRRSPVPLHSGHRSGSLPGSAPEPAQVGHVTRVGNRISRVTPVTASARVMVRS